MQVRYFFNQTDQTFNISFDPDFLPGEEWQEVDQEKHDQYLEAVNSRKIILADGTFSDPRPSNYHAWENGNWIDQRTEEQIKASEMKLLTPLTRRQFRMVFVLNGYDLDAIKAKILEIEDIQTRQITLVEWEDATTFERDNASLIMMAELLGLEDDQVNTMWKQALSL
ncbi:MAG: hypothetical protein ACK4GA_02565 [Acinetobacter sp.]|uniref:hypothetical protein n=1 Tax=Acinetobacter sp. TaxID=472 RepID=UPI003919F907